jgi:four helix bundle protein
LQIAICNLQIENLASAMSPEEMRERTKEFAKRVIKLCRHLPDTQEARLIRNQLFRSATSVGANYRSASRGRSRADFVAKMGIILEEADESLYWMELIVETEMMKRDLLSSLMQEANELVAIMVASLKTAKQR